VFTESANACYTTEIMEVLNEGCLSVMMSVRPLHQLNLCSWCLEQV